MGFDSAFVQGSRHVREGLPCQDYALSSSSWAAVSDGCSSAGHTDLGSRAWTWALAKTLAAGPFSLDRLLMEALRLRFTDGPDWFATLGWLEAKPEGGLKATLFGDGAVAARTKEGNLLWLKADYGNTPFYPEYFLTGIRPGKPTLSGNLAWRPACAEGVEVDLPADVITAAVMTDGAFQVRGFSFPEILPELMGFKSPLGAFAKRRLIRMGKDREFIDDFSMGAWHVDQTNPAG